MSNLRYTYPPSKRFKKKSHFSEFFKSTKRIDNYYFRVYHSKAKYEEGKWAYGINKKCGPAHKRNLLKRRLKEIMRLNQHHIQNLNDIYISCKPSAMTLSYDDVTTQLKHILNKAKLITTETRT